MISSSPARAGAPKASGSALPAMSAPIPESAVRRVIRNAAGGILSISSSIRLAHAQRHVGQARRAAGLVQAQKAGAHAKDRCPVRQRPFIRSRAAQLPSVCR
jgi:hypothetical protein